MLPEGLVKTIVNGGDFGSLPIGRGDIVTAKYTCYSAGAGDSASNNNVLIARSDSQKMVSIVFNYVLDWTVYNGYHMDTILYSI